MRNAAINHAQYRALSQHSVAEMHRRFMARHELRVEAALAGIADAEVKNRLRPLALDLALHATRMRIAGYSDKQLAQAVTSVANSSDMARAAQRHKDELTAAADLRERLASPRFGAAVVPQDKMKDIYAAAAARTADAHIEDIFAGKPRLYLALERSRDAAQDSIAEALAAMPPVRAGDTAGYQIIDWAKGYARDCHGKQQFRIGKLLRQHAPDLLALFDARSNNDLMVVISRDADDIARASTNRGWHSCAGAGRGGLDAYDKLPQGIQAGMMIAYLISANDPDVHNPLARLMLYPFIRDAKRDKHFGVAPTAVEKLRDHVSRAFARAIGRAPLPQRHRIWHPGKYYGLDNPDFTRVVTAFVDGRLNAGGTGHYWQPYDIYHPGFHVVVRNQGVTEIKRSFKT